MKNDAQKNMLLLGTAGFVLVIVNVAVIMGARSGQIAPIDNMMFWGAFAVLNVCSLLWAVSLLGLQPMVVAVAYAVGGFLAFRGVRLMSDLHVAEVASAGATYGAFGALVVGHATTKVRQAFFDKRQVPFVFLIIALLLMDGLLNGRVASAGWNVITRALLAPFMLAGVTLGLVWMLLVRVRAGRSSTKNETQAIEAEEPILMAAEESEEAAQLMFSVPEHVENAEPLEVTESVPDPEPEGKETLLEAAVDAASGENDSMEDDSSFDHFFPLEIDKDETALPLAEEEPALMNVAAMVAESAPELAVEADLVFERDPPPLEEEEMASLSEEAPVLEPAPVEEPAPKEQKTNSTDWLSSHLDLLNKLEK